MIYKIGQIPKRKNNKQTLIKKEDGQDNSWQRWHNNNREKLEKWRALIDKNSRPKVRNFKIYMSNWE